MVDDATRSRLPRQDVTKVGKETVAGTSTTHDRVTVDVDKLPGTASLRERFVPTLPMQVWLDDQGQGRRQQVDMTIQTRAARATGQPGRSPAPQQIQVITVMEFSDFGNDVKAEALPAQQVADMTDKALQSGPQQR